MGCMWGLCVCGGVGLIVDLWQWQEGVEGVRWWDGVEGVVDLKGE